MGPQVKVPFLILSSEKNHFYLCCILLPVCGWLSHGLRGKGTKGTCLASHGEINGKSLFRLLPDHK